MKWSSELERSVAQTIKQLTKELLKAGAIPINHTVVTDSDLKHPTPAIIEKLFNSDAGLVILDCPPGMKEDLIANVPTFPPVPSDNAIRLPYEHKPVSATVFMKKYHEADPEFFESYAGHKQIFLFNKGPHTFYAKDVDMFSSVCNFEYLYNPVRKATPSFLRSKFSGDILKHCPPMPGINTPYLYFSGPSSMFPMHRENDLAVSINLSLGPFAKLWFAVPGKFTQRVEELIAKLQGRTETQQGEKYVGEGILCERNAFLFVEQLREAGLPVYFGFQTQFSFVITGTGTIHWGVNEGPTTNIAYNQVPPCSFLAVYHAQQRSRELRVRCAQMRNSNELWSMAVLNLGVARAAESLLKRLSASKLDRKPEKLFYMQDLINSLQFVITQELEVRRVCLSEQQLVGALRVPRDWNTDVTADGDRCDCGVYLTWHEVCWNGRRECLRCVYDRLKGTPAGSDDSRASSADVRVTVTLADLTPLEAMLTSLEAKRTISDSHVDS